MELIGTCCNNSAGGIMSLDDDATLVYTGDVRDILSGETVKTCSNDSPLSIDFSFVNNEQYQIEPHRCTVDLEPGASTASPIDNSERSVELSELLFEFKENPQLYLIRSDIAPSSSLNAEDSLTDLDDFSDGNNSDYQTRCIKDNSGLNLFEDQSNRSVSNSEQSESSSERKEPLKKFSKRGIQRWCALLTAAKSRIGEANGMRAILGESLWKDFVAYRNAKTNHRPQFIDVFRKKMKCCGPYNSKRVPTT